MCICRFKWSVLAQGTEKSMINYVTYIQRRKQRGGFSYGGRKTEQKMGRRIRQKYQFTVSAKGTERKNHMCMAAFDRGNHKTDKLLSLKMFCTYIY